MKISANTNLKQTQNLTMTPSLQQALKVLQMTSAELEMEVMDYLDRNIMLELDDSSERNSDEILTDSNENLPLEKEVFDTEQGQNQEGPLTHETSAEALSFDEDKMDYNVETDWDGFQDTDSFSGSQDEENNPLENMNSHSESLQDVLMWQLNLSTFSPLDRVIAELLIDSINADGYLGITLEDALSALQRDYPDLELDEVQAVLRRIQYFDPCGVGARTLEECLCLQLRALNPYPSWADKAQTILTEYSGLLARLDLVQLSRKLKINETALRTILNELRHLNPKPGLIYGSSEPAITQPDILVDIVKNKVSVTLNPSTVPKIRINQTYERIAQTQKKMAMLKEHLNDARFFIRAVNSRFDTLLNVAHEIVEHQKAFFFEGESAMRSLQLKQIAEKLEIHESTVSRAIAGKTLLCPTGIYELKFFFSNQMTNAQVVATPNGLANPNQPESDDPSGVAIRAALKQLIANEPSEKPYSDSKLEVLLKAEGFSVARRTIAKYREALGILSSTERRTLR